MYEQNTHALAYPQGKASQVHTRLLDTLETTAAEENLELHATPDGGVTIQYQGHFLHSPEGVLAEVRNACNQQCKPGNNNHHILFGLGVGYLLKEVFERSAGNIYLFEPNLALLKFTLSNVDLSKYFGSGRVFIADSPDALYQHIRSCYIFGDHFDYIMLPGCAPLFGNHFSAVTEKIETMIFGARINLSTLHVSNLQWAQQFFENLPEINQSFPLEAVDGLYSGKPAVIVSSGPSLEGALDTLKAYQDRMVILAVGGAAGVILKAGIQPDYVGYMDCLGMQEQINAVPEGSSQQWGIIVSPFVQHCAFTCPARERLVMTAANSHNFAQWMDQALQVKHKHYHGGPTVSMILLEAATRMNCHPIILVGQDLAIVNQKVYAGGVEATVEENGKINVAHSETVFGKKYNSAEIQGQDGSMLLTTTHYKLFAQHLEGLAKENEAQESPIKLYNASIGGAYLNGFDHQPLADIMQQLDPSPFTKNLKPILPEGYPEGTRKTERIQKHLQHHAKELAACIEQAKIIRDTIKTMSELPNTKWQKHLQTYQLARKQFEELMNNNPFISSCINVETLRFSRASENVKDLTEDFKLVESYFDACVEIFETHHTAWLKQAIERFGQPSDTPADPSYSRG